MLVALVTDPHGLGVAEVLQLKLVCRALVTDEPTAGPSAETGGLKVIVYIKAIYISYRQYFSQMATPRNIMVMLVSVTQMLNVHDKWGVYSLIPIPHSQDPSFHQESGGFRF